MGNESTIFTVQWGAELLQLAQQEVSLLEGTVKKKTDAVGERVTMHQVAARVMTKNTNRHDPIVPNDPDLRRRWITMFDYDDACLFDSQDAMKTLLNPQNEFNQGLIMGANRLKDTVIIQAANATAYIGKDGTSTQAMTSANQIANGSAGLTLAKIRNAARLFHQGYVNPTEKRYLVIGPKDHDDLLALTEVASQDYNDRPVLVDGFVKRFMGFDIIISQLLADLNTVTATGITTCLAYTQTGIGLALALEPKLDVSIRNDIKGLPTQAYCAISCGASRLEESKVITIDTYHA